MSTCVVSRSAAFMPICSPQTIRAVLPVLVECSAKKNAADLLTTQVDMEVYTDDFYFGGPGDEITGLTVTPLGERYLGIPEDLPGKTNGAVDVIDFGAFPGNTDELGIMLFTNGDRGSGNRGGATQDSEALLIRAQ